MTTREELEKQLSLEQDGLKKEEKNLKRLYVKSQALGEKATILATELGVNPASIESSLRTSHDEAAAQGSESKTTQPAVEKVTEELNKAYGTENLKKPEPIDDSLLRSKFAEVAAEKLLTTFKSLKRPSFENLKNRIFKGKESTLVADLAPDIERLLPEFRNLNEQQQLFVLEATGSRLYEKVKEDARNRFSEKLAGAGSLGGSKRTVLGKIAGRIATIPTAMRKNYLIARYEKDALRYITSNTLARHDFVTGQIAEIAKVTKETGLRAYRSSDTSEVLFQYLNVGMTEDAERSKIFDEYNRAATRLSRIPYQWRTTDATQEERAAFKKAQANLESQTKGALLALVAESRERETENPEAYAAEYLAQIKALTELNGFLFSNPDAAKHLRRIEKGSALVRGATDIATERATLSAQGALMRAISGSLVGSALLAAPITGSVLGFFRGRSRARENLKQELQGARQGKAQSEKTAIRMSLADRKISRLATLLENIKEEVDVTRIGAYAKELKLQADFVQAKLDRGEVNFGTEDGRFERQFTLIGRLHQARTALATIEGFEDGSMPISMTDAEQLGSLERRVRSFGALSEKSAEKARERLVTVSALRSAFYGALFASAGAVVADYFHGNSPAKIHETHSVKTIGGHKTEILHAERLVKDVENKINELRREHPVSVTFSSKGAGQTILDFRHSQEFNKLSPEVQKFFRGNVWEVTKKLKELTADGKSVTVGSGSQFGVDDHGNIFLTDTGHGGQKLVLGHIKNGTFVEGKDISKLEYLHTTKHPSSHEVVHQNHENTPTERPALTQTSVTGEHVASADTTDTTSEPGIGAAKQENSLVDTDASYGWGDKKILSLPEEQRLFAEKMATSRYYSLLDRFFAKRNFFGNISRHGIDSKEWAELYHQRADIFMRIRPEEMRPEFREIAKEIHKLARDHQEIRPGTMTLERFVHVLFEEDSAIDVEALYREST